MVHMQPLMQPLMQPCLSCWFDSQGQCNENAKTKPRDNVRQCHWLRHLFSRMKVGKVRFFPKSSPPCRMRLFASDFRYTQCDFVGSVKSHTIKRIGCIDLYGYTTNSFCYEELLQIKVGEMAETSASLPSISEYSVIKSRNRR